MAELKNNSLLEKIIQYSKTIGGGDQNSLTVERFIVSVIDAVSGVPEIELTDDEQETLEQMLFSRFAISREELPALKALFTSQIEENQTSFVSSMHMRTCIYKARQDAQNSGMEQLTAEVVLKKIFENPNAFMMQAFGATFKKDDDEETPEQPQEAPAPAGETEEAAPAEQTDAPATPQAETTPVNPRSSIEALSKKVSMIREKLNQVVFGQENAIEVFTTGYFQSEMIRATDDTRTRPAGIFLFAGPPGVGKTFLVKNIVDVLGMQKKFVSFDMSEYADHNAHMELIGYDDNYKTPKEGLLTGFVNKHPKSILLFDELEKANSNVIHLFLQILEEGYLTDKKTQKRVSFKDTLIFFTSNLGKELYNAPDAFNFSGISRKVIMKALQREINPYSGQPYLPSALASRIASGNVVMFNHMSAGSLCKIVETSIRKKAEGFEKAYQVKIDLDSDVYTALLFAEGGAADARSLRGRAERFFDDEIFELSRLLASEERGGDITKLENIRFDIELPDNKEVSSLFRNSEEHNILIFSSGERIGKCAGCCSNVHMLGVEDVASVKQTMSSKNVGFAIIDLWHGIQGEGKFINMEDVESTARDIFWYIREKYANLPIYILQHSNHVLTKEEQSSYLREGAYGFLTLDEDCGAFSAEVAGICNEIYQRASMRTLASANKLVSYESGQRVSEDGKTAEVTLFDFELSTAVDVEDTQNVMSNVSKPSVRFTDIVGAENAKAELQFFIEYLKNPKQFVESGLRTPRGVLLYGPPGTGKTLLAKAVAAEAGVTFISAEGNQFIKKYVGEGKDNLHELFSVARKYAPAILFIDEFEAIAKERRGGDHSAANGEDVLTALLTEMDGFNTDITRPVFVLAATNFDVTPGSDKSLDPALLRRFDSKICVDLPNKEERIRFINMKRQSSKAFVISDEEVENIALRSTGMSLADLDSIMELSLRTAIRKEDQKVTDQVLDEAFEIFLGGEEKAWDASQLERTARHEAGHTFLCWHGGETPSYVTIVARGDHGGYMQHGDEGKQLYTKDELLARIRTSLGGRAAEIVYYGEKDGISTGASGDLASATNLARHIICTYGMDDDFGLAVIGQSSDGALQREVRDAINKILEEEMKNAIDIIRENRASIDALVGRLLSDNHLTGDEIKSIFEHQQN